MRVWQEVEEVFTRGERKWLSGGEISRLVRAYHPARSDATVRATVGFYCINDRGKNSSPGTVYRSRPILVTSDPTARGKKYRLLTATEVALFLARPRYDLETNSYSELMEWLDQSGQIREGESIHPTGSVRPPDLILVGCVKSKLPGRHIAAELYTSPLFRARRAYAESAAVPWFILSAEHGLLSPSAAVESYDTSLAAFSAEQRAKWTSRVLAQLDSVVGELKGRLVELHAGSIYRQALSDGLRSRGALVGTPLQGLRLGEQLARYRSLSSSDAIKSIAPSKSLPTENSPARRADARNLARLITEDFLEGTLDLARRPGAPVPGWESMPEHQAWMRWAQSGASAAEGRVLLTLVAALDRARDAGRLWSSATRLYDEQGWVCRRGAAQRSLHELRDALARYGVSQRHTSDAACWRLILESLHNEAGPEAVRKAVFDGIGDATELLQAVGMMRSSGQQWFPFLSGPKVSVMWIRMLAWPGGAQIQNLDALPVAVDVQVRKVTELLGVTDTVKLPIEAARLPIQDAWQRASVDAVGPAPLNSTATALDPAHWFFAKWGCSFCVAARRPVPIGRACEACTLISTDPTPK